MKFIAIRASALAIGIVLAQASPALAQEAVGSKAAEAAGADDGEIIVTALTAGSFKPMGATLKTSVSSAILSWGRSR